MFTNTTSMICAGTALIGVCYGFARFAYGLFEPVFREAFALQATLAGIIGSGSYLGYSIAIVASFWLTSRFGPRAMAIAAGALATGGTVLVACAPNGPTLAVGILIAGSSTGLASPPMAEAISRTITAGKQDKAQSIVNAGTGLGVLLSGPIALTLLQNWRWAWTTFGIIGALVSAWVAVTVPAGHHPEGTRTSTGKLLPTGAARLALAATLMGLGSAAVWTFGRAMVTEQGHASQALSTLMWTVIGLAGLLGAFSGHLTAKLGLPAAFSLAMTGLAASTTAIAVWPGSAAVVIVGAACFGATYIALCGLVLVWSTRVYPDHPATGVGVSFLMIAVGQIIGTPAVGALIEHAGYTTAFLACAVCALLGAAVRYRPVPRPRNTEHDATRRERSEAPL